MSLDGKVAIITGAGRGIGRAIALRFAADGAKLALVSRTKDQLEEVKAEVIAAGGHAIAMPTDVTSEAEVQSMVEATERALGPVDILVNNAGIMALGSIADTSTDEWNKIMGTNLLGPFLCSRAVLGSMMRRNAGRIVNIGSMAGRRGYPEQGAYVTSKHGLVGLTKVLAIECQPYGIKVNMVSPGGVLTDLSTDLLNSRGGAAQASDWMTAGEVADGVYYIVSQNGPAMTDELVLRRSASEPWR